MGRVMDVFEDRTSKYEKTESKNSQEKREKELAKIELQKTAELCGEYHQKFDRTKYFDSRAVKLAAEMLPKFKNLNIKILPRKIQLVVAPVVAHRIAYLETMEKLKGNSRLLKLMDAGIKSGIGLFNNNYSRLKAELQKMPEYNKVISELDLREALSAVTPAISKLKTVAGVQGNWDTQASLYLKGVGKDSRIDDKTAAANLLTGFSTLSGNIQKLLGDRRKEQQAPSR